MKKKAYWKIINEEVLLSCPPYLDVAKQTIIKPDGKIIDDYYQIYMPSYTAIFAYEEKLESVYILEGYRHGSRKHILGFPGGMVEKGETPSQCAQRELLEETGFKAKKLALYWKLF